MRWVERVLVPDIRVRRKLPLLVVLCAGLAMSTPGEARQTIRTDPTYLIDTWETEDGLPENSATAMAQTPDGYLWFGTFGGLVRFDGVAFTVFDPANTPQLPSASIINLYCDRSGRLWVSTSRGLTVREGGAWRALGAGDGWPNDYVRTFSERGNGDLLITTFHGQVFEFVGGRIAELPAPPGQPGMGYMGGVDGAGHWWIAQHKFVGQWDGQHWRQTIIPTTPDPAHVGCSSARDGGVWLLMETELRKYRDGIEVSRIQLPEVPGGLWSLSEDTRGNVWICTGQQGVCRVSPDGQMRRWTTTNGLGALGTRFVFEDREGDLWVGTNGGGLARFKPRRFQSFGVESGLTERVVDSLWPGRDGGEWIGTRGKGLFHLHDGRATSVPLPDARAVVLAQSVLTDRRGRLWLGTNRDLWVSENGAFRKSHPDLLSGADIRALFEDSHQRIWIGGGRSAAVLDGVSLRVFTAADGLAPDGAYCFAEDSHGVIWLSTHNGVFRSENDHFAELLDNGRPLRDILCFKADADGTLWMGSRDQGLLRRRDEKITRIGGLPVRAVYGILEDSAGYLWLTGNRGVVRVSAKALRSAAEDKVSRPDFQVLGLSDGLPSVECAGGQQPTCARDASGRLWFATLKGVATIDPAAFRLNTIPPPVIVEQVGYNAPAPTNEVDVRVAGPFTKPLRLPLGTRRIEIQYTALSFSAPEHVRFQVKLEGQDADWRDAGDRRIASFYDLPPGDYTFRVRAANNDGVWNETGASLTFKVQPYLWQATWFRFAAAVVLFGGGGGLIWRTARARHRREMAELERTQRQQTELAHLSRVTMLGELSGSMAHELNQPLTAILSNAQAAQRFLARDPVDLDEVRDILTDIVEQDNRAGEVIQRLRLLLKKGEVQRRPLDLNEVVREVLQLLRSDLVNQGVTTDTALAPALPVVNADRVQLEQILLNLVMNACDAMSGNAPGDRRVLVQTELTLGHTVTVSVSDSGAGIASGDLERVFEPFFTTKMQGLGLGLSVCRSIITAHGGKLWAAHNPDRGATFHFSLPVDPAVIA